jgi:hypothetical protein
MWLGFKLLCTFFSCDVTGILGILRRVEMMSQVFSHKVDILQNLFPLLMILLQIKLVCLPMTNLHQSVA